MDNPDSTISVVISLGSNLSSKYGTPQDTVKEAFSRLRTIAMDNYCTSIQLSSLYLTEPCDCEEGTPDFVNAAVHMRLPLGLSPQSLLEQLLAIEVEFGRVLDGSRGQRENQPRSLDLDLICFGNQTLKEKNLTLPHPRAQFRRFVLEPIAEICPDLILPGQESSILGLLDSLSESERVQRL